jgi:hypothetical protein
MQWTGKKTNNQKKKKKRKKTDESAVNAVLEIRRTVVVFCCVVDLNSTSAICRCLDVQLSSGDGLIDLIDDRQLTPAAGM